MLLSSASLIPSKTFSIFPNLVILLYFSGLIVSRETLILLIPFSFSSLAYFFNNVPFVVSVISFRFVFSFLVLSFSINFIISFLTKGSPPVNLIFSTPSSIKLSHNLSISSKVSMSFRGRNCIFSFIQ